MSTTTSFVSIMGILSHLFPDRTSVIMATCEAIFGVGFTFGENMLVWMAWEKVD